MAVITDRPGAIPEYSDKTDGGGGSETSIGFKILNGALPEWHNRYTPNGVTEIDLQTLCATNDGIHATALTSWGNNFTRSNTSVSPLLANNNKKYREKACDLYVDANGNKPIYKGTECLSANLSVKGYMQVYWEPGKTITIERKYNNQKLSYGLYSEEKAASPTEENGWLTYYYETTVQTNDGYIPGYSSEDLDWGVPYVTYLAVCGAGSGGSSGSDSIPNRTNGGGGGATFCGLVDWTEVKKLEITFGKGGAGQVWGSGTSSSRGQWSKIKVIPKNNERAEYIYIEGGQVSWADTDKEDKSGKGGSIIKHTTYDLSIDSETIQGTNVKVGDNLKGVICLAAVPGGSGNSHGAGTGNQVNISSVPMTYGHTPNLMVTFPIQPGGMGGEPGGEYGYTELTSISTTSYPWNETDYYLQLVTTHTIRAGKRQPFCSCGGGASMLGAGGCGASTVTDFDGMYGLPKKCCGFPGVCGGGGGAGVYGFYSNIGNGGAGGNGAMYMAFPRYS